MRINLKLNLQNKKVNKEQENALASELQKNEKLLHFSQISIKLISFPKGPTEYSII